VSDEDLVNEDSTTHIWHSRNTHVGLPDYILPKWLLLVSTIATFSAAQSITEHSFNRKVYTKGGASGMGKWLHHTATSACVTIES
jgi:hypothetical protein